jgi:hypothetical protein
MKVEWITSAGVCDLRPALFLEVSLGDAHRPAFDVTSLFCREESGTRTATTLRTWWFFPGRFRDRR